MPAGEYSINVQIGNYRVAASKVGYISEINEDVEVSERQTTEVNFQLGGEKMGTYTKPIVVKDGNMTTINVPVEEPTVPKKFLDMGTPMVTKVVELLTEDGATVLQTQTTNVEGIVTFENVLHGHYNVTIHY